MTFGEAVHEARLSHPGGPKSMFWLSKASGVSEPQICLIENGRVKQCQEITIRKLMKALPTITEHYKPK